MATKESIMIRIEKGQDRIKNALARLQAETGAEISEITLTEKDSLSRQAELSEILANNLEALCRIIVPELEEEIPFDLQGDVNDVYTGVTDGEDEEDDELAPITLNEIAKTKLGDAAHAKPDTTTTSGEAGKPTQKPKK